MLAIKMRSDLLECRRDRECVNTHRPLTHTSSRQPNGGAMPEHTQTKTCTIPGCDREYRARGWCGTHYSRWERTGTTADPNRPPTRTKCSVDECDRKPRSRVAEYCEMHYYRLRRNGTLETVKPRVPDAPCIVDGCEVPAFTLEGECRNHSLWRKRNGDYFKRSEGPLSWNWRNADDMTWAAIHNRVRKAFGPAKKYDCVDCGRRAAHWSYNHQDPNERTDVVRGRKAPVGTSIEFYEPRCVPCHKRLDLAKIAERAS